ncbi:hypothetical protein GE300_20150 [Rhodobacteraceae bacterium 2CG4]|uniref:Uncharacterized protein n=1 Tax=Halovulum marinum TaxID=2662447 RepID=A0A6L5Z622_9RHOB|nr:hypothetical protein [Halovulum marinum]MSU91887.1 hypothetical protein [Halovulum marinum]
MIDAEDQLDKGQRVALTRIFDRFQVITQEGVLGKALPADWKAIIDPSPSGGNELVSIEPSRIEKIAEASEMPTP